MFDTPSAVGNTIARTRRAAIEVTPSSRLRAVPDRYIGSTSIVSSAKSTVLHVANFDSLEVTGSLDMKHSRCGMFVVCDGLIFTWGNRR